jgi:membrane protease YdiL (CAAX protease family)
MPVWPALAGFYALALAISWGWMLPFVVAGSVVHRGIGWPTHVPALLGPLVAAVVVTAWTKGVTGLRELVGRMIRWRVGIRWWFWSLSPLVYFAAGATLVRLTDGGWPSLSGLDRYSGLPAIGVIGVWLLALLTNGIGEETGWRGFALPQIQRRYTPLVASLALVPMWALWHAPYFAVLSTYRGFAPFQYAGFVFGLACGSVVLTWLYNRSGASILIVAVWHATFNMFGGATDATQGTIAAVVSTAVMIQAIVLVGIELRARHRGSGGILGPLSSPMSKAGR